MRLCVLGILSTCPTLFTLLLGPGLTFVCALTPTGIQSGAKFLVAAGIWHIVIELD